MDDERDRLIISNTTPLINLAEIGRLDIFENLFGRVVIPPAVRAELVGKQHLFPRASAAALSGQFEIHAPEDKLLVSGFSGLMHPGEAECLALAMEHPGSLLLLDDLTARNVAESNRLPFTGTLGCLVKAKSRGLIDAVALLLHDLRTEARYWISQKLESTILADAGED